jgi:hypothetical protein
LLLIGGTKHNHVLTVEADENVLAKAMKKMSAQCKNNAIYMLNFICFIAANDFEAEHFRIMPDFTSLTGNILGYRRNGNQLFYINFAQISKETFDLPKDIVIDRCYTVGADKLLIAAADSKFVSQSV